MDHVGVTGSREGMTHEQGRCLVAYFQFACDLYEKDLTLHHGCCVGVDEGTHGIAGMFGVESIGYPPEKTDFMMDLAEYDFLELKDPKPYLMRNRDIVDSVETLLVVPNASRELKTGGTWYTYRYAKKKKIDIIIFWPDGTASHEGVIRS